MMKLIRNGEPYIFEHRCSVSEKNQIMSEEEKREFFVEYFLGIFFLKKEMAWVDKCLFFQGYAFDETI